METKKAIIKFKDYEGVRGRALSVQVDIRDMAAYHDADRRLAGCHDGDWHSARGNEYIPQRISGAESARAAVKGFILPEALRSEARRHARTLAQVFTEIASKVVLRDQVSGRMDRRKLDEVAQHTARGYLDVNQVRPFRRVIQAPSRPPVVAVVASAGNAEMWMDSEYIPRVLKLMLSVSWAAEAAGLPVYGAMVQGHCELRETTFYKEAHQAFMVLKPGQRVSATAYAVGLHRDLWRYGIMTVWGAGYEEASRLIQLRGESLRVSAIHRCFPCVDGGNAVTWARAALGADVVISIGANQDAAKAEVQLKARFNLGDAVAEIQRQAKGMTR